MCILSTYAAPRPARPPTYPNKTTHNTNTITCTYIYQQTQGYHALFDFLITPPHTLIQPQTHTHSLTPTPTLSLLHAYRATTHSPTFSATARSSPGPSPPPWHGCWRNATPSPTTLARTMVRWGVCVYMHVYAPTQHEPPPTRPPPMTNKTTQHNTTNRHDG